MRKTLNILGNSVRLTLQELKVNKLRTALSLTGVAFGIFCVIGVLATVGSLQTNIQNQVNTLGTNTIYIDKWDYNGGPDQPIWKFRARPTMTKEDADFIKLKSGLLDDVAFLLSSNGSVTYNNDIIQGIPIYGIVEAQLVIQPLQFESGRYFSATEFTNGNNVCLIGFDNAESLFGTADRAVDRQIEINGRRITVVGVFKKQGKDMFDWNFDNCVMLPNKYFTQLFNKDYANPVIIAKGKEGVKTAALSDELRGIMRQERKLGPLQEDNFSLNSVEAISKSLSSFFVILNIAGAIIGGISLVIGMFGIANIMFVTVKERTSVIGLKKAIGAKKSSILFEFLLEATLLCIFGGLFGLVFVYIATLLLTNVFKFPVFISIPMLIITVAICIVVGILAGIIPASRASKLDAVVAIRSK